MEAGSARMKVKFELRLDSAAGCSVMPVGEIAREDEKEERKMERRRPSAVYKTRRVLQRAERGIALYGRGSDKREGGCQPVRALK